MRLVKCTTAVLLALLTAAGCGNSTSPTAPHPSSTAAAPVSAPVTQPLDSWYTEAFVPMTTLSTAYTELGKVSASGTPMSGRPEVADLRSAADAGLRVPAPAGHPDIDRAYDLVMTDSLAVADDIDSGSASFWDDALTASNDMNDLKALLNGTSS